MKLRFPLDRIRAAFTAWRNRDPRQAGRLGTVVRFFAAMLILTLASRGIAGASMPRVTLGQASAGSITQSCTASGFISVQGGTPLTVPEGVLVAQVTAATGQSLSKGDAIARFDAVSLAQALETKQAQVEQLEVSVAQLSEPDQADDFSLRQAQQQLDRAYADTQQTWQEGEDAIEKARQQRDAAQNALDALRNQPAATPESAETERQQKIAEAQTALDAAESALAAAQESAAAANKAATDTAQSYEDARNSAAHNYGQAAEEIAGTNAANQAQAAVTQAELDVARRELSALQALEAADGVFSAPADGTLTQLNLVAGQNSASVAGLLADQNAASVLTFSLDQETARLATVGTQITVKQGSQSAQTTITALSEPSEEGSMEITAMLNDGDWKAGSATAEIKLNAGQFAQCLPATAIQTDGSGMFVYLVEEQSTLLGTQNVLIRLPVTVEVQGGGMAAVSGSISGQVVTGADKPLSEGAWVRVTS